MTDRLRDLCLRWPAAAAEADVDCSCTENPTSAILDVTGDGDDVLIPVGNGVWRLPDEEVQWVLGRRREDVRSDLFGAEHVDEFFEYQAWVRAEHDAHGGLVFVDEQFVKDREEHQRWMDEWSARLSTDGVGLGEVDLSDRLSDFYEDSEDEDEEKVQEVYSGDED